MRRAMILAAGVAATGLGGCVSYHQEVAALRMPRPSAHSVQLSAYAAPDPDYPSVGGNILKGTSPKATAAFDATNGDEPPPAPDASGR